MSDQEAPACRDAHAHARRSQRRSAAAIAAAVVAGALVPSAPAAVPGLELRPLQLLVDGARRPLAAAATLTGTIAPGGGPVSFTLGSGDTARLTFTGAPGQRISWTQSGSLGLYTTVLLDPNGQQIASCGYDCNYGTAFLDTKTLLVGGAYTIVLTPLNGRTGTWTITLYDVPADVTASASPPVSGSGSPASLTISTPGQNGTLTFTGQAGHRLSWSQSGSIGLYDTLLYGPGGGGALASCGYDCDYGTAFLEPITLPADGTYTIVFNPRYAQTGTWTIRLYDVPPNVSAVLPRNGAVAMAVTTPGQDASASLTGYAGEQMTISSNGSTGNLYDFGLADPNGTTIAQGNYYQTSFTKTLPVSGTYVVWFTHRYANTGTARLTSSTTYLPPPANTIGVGANGRGIHARTGSRLIAEPVNSLTGAFTDSASDLSLPGVGVSFALTRSYTSIDAVRGRLGLGWTDSYSASLAVQPNGDLLLHGEDGQQIAYAKQPDGSFAGEAGALSKLRSVGGGYELTRVDQVVYSFDGQGRLTAMKDRNGQGLAFAYDASGRLTIITDSVGRQIALTYNAAGLLAAVATPDGRRVSYGYTGNLLTSVTDAAGRRTTYTYDSGNRLASIVDANGNARVRNTYGADGRVAQQLDALGNRTSFAWDPATQTETVTDARGSVWKDVYQGAKLVERIDPLGNVTRYAYDAQLDVTSVTGPDGNTVTQAFDGNGNLTQVSSAALNATKEIAYDARNDVTSITDARGTVTTYGYDAAGNLTSVVQAGQTVARFAYDSAGRRTSSTDGRGGTTTYTYDSQGNLASVTDSLGATTTFGYDAAGRLSVRTDPLGNSTRYGYDASGLLLSETDPAGAKTTYAYDAAGNRTSVTDANGHTTRFGYDAANRLVSLTSGGGGVTSYAYDGAGNRVATTDPNGGVTTSTYDADNRLASTTTPLGERTTYAYDAAGNLASVTDPRGGTTSYAYDAAGRLLAETDAAAGVTQHRYDAIGNETSLTDPLGHVTTYGYDPRGRLVSTTAPDGGRTTYGYDGNGNVVARTDANGKTWRRAYDAADRVSSETTPLGEKTTYRYDAAGNLIATIEPRGNVSGANPADYTTTYAYDVAGRLVSSTNPLGGTTAYAYDAAGNRIAVTDADGHRTSYGYDAADRLVTVAAPDGGATTYAYDAAGNVVSRTDANNHKTTFAYDADNRRTAIVSPTGQRWTFSYDASGNLGRVVDANGNATGTAGDGTTSYAYDAVGRLTTVSYSDSTPSVAFSYDAAGNRTQMRDGAGTVTYAYDAANRLLQASRGGDTFAYAYDPAGNVVQKTYPDGATVASSYDGDGRLATVASGGAPTSYTYDPDGHLAQVTFPNGYVESRTYDRAGRLVQARTAKGASVLAELKLTLDPVGNPTLVERTGTAPATAAYTYDAADRLTSVCFKASCPKSNDPYVRWTYDRVGNRLTEKRGPSTTTYAYDAADELLVAGGTSYTYDQNGNQLSAGSRTFTYDLANRLVSTAASGVTTTIRYDGDGNRLSASSGPQASQTISYVWDVSGALPQLALERDGSGALLRRYVHAAGPVSMVTPSGAFYFHRDHVGSVTNVTSATAKTEWTDLYEPFGAVRTETKNDPAAPANPMKFAGEYLEAFGLYNLRAREYDPASGRFLTQDPVAPSATNPYVSSYVYANDRPTVLVDPSGETVAFAADALDATLGAASGAALGIVVGSSPTACAARPGYPLSQLGRLIGRPGEGTHSYTAPPNNWQSDRAIDIAVPVGTRVCAAFSGVIGPLVGPLDSSNPRFAGVRLTLVGLRDELYYAHLSRIVVHAYQRVERDQLLGYSGSANGVPHLHLGVRYGDPLRYAP